MNAYITLDGKKYATLHKDWTPGQDNARVVRMTSLGAADVTFASASMYEWEGTIVAKYTPETGYGSYSDLMTSLAKKSLLTFIDHLGNAHNVVAFGPFKPKCTIPNWDSPSASFHVNVKLTKV